MNVLKKRSTQYIHALNKSRLLQRYNCKCTLRTFHYLLLDINETILRSSVHVARAFGSNIPT